MSAKNTEELDFFREVKSRFSKMIIIDANSNLFYANDSAKDEFYKNKEKKIEISELDLWAFDYKEIIDLLDLKLFNIKIGLTSFKVLGIIENEGTNKKLFFELLEDEDPIRYISNIQHFRLKRETWYKAIAYSMPDIIFIYDINGTYLDVIAKYDNWNNILTGSSLKLIGRNIKEILSKEQSEVFLNKIAEVIKTKNTIEFEYSLNMQYDQEIKHYSALISPIKGDNAVIWVARDITELYNTRMNIKEAKDYFEKSDKLKSSIISNLNHEVRTPLNIIMNTVEFLKSTSSDDNILNQLKIIEDSSGHLLSLFENMVALSEQNIEGIRLINESYNFHDMITSVVTHLNEFAMEKGLYLLLDISHDVPINIIGDKGKMMEVIKHLISNSIKFTELGSILLKVKSFKKYGKTYIDISVKDTGVGISDDDKKRMFNSFEKGLNNSYSLSSGMGIGLSLVKKIVDLMNGSIECISKVYEGTNFIIKIPIELDYTMQNYYIRNDELFSEINVLILDSYAQSREITQRAIGSFKFSTTSFATLDEGLAFVENDKSNNTKIVIIDENCISSYNKADEICDSLRERGVEKIIVCTKLFDKDVINIYNKNIIDHYLVKPIAYSSFFNTVVSKLRPYEKKIKDFESKLQFKDKKALVVDDNYINREIASTLLSSLGISVDQAVDGEEAYKKTLSEEYNIIFMDLEMPNVDGYMSADLIRSLESYKDTPIVAISASNYDSVKIKLEEHKFNNYISKPIEIDEVIKLLISYFGNEMIIYDEDSSKTFDNIDKELMRFPYLNYKRVLERVCGDKNLVVKMLKNFSADLSITINELKNHIELRNTKELHMILHILKGTCGNLGFDIVYDKITKLDNKISFEDYENTNYLELIEMLNNIAKFDFKSEKKIMSKEFDILSEKIDKEYYNSLLIKLSESLSIGKIKEIKILADQLNVYNYIMFENDFLEHLNSKISRYRFKEAKMLIDEIIEI